jgi:ATP-dependent Clp protease ATP-binding subunit ClpA
MMFERFTDAAREVVVDAKAEAVALHHPYVGTEHLLLALLRPEAGLPATLLARAGITAAAVRERLAGLAYQLPDEAGTIDPAVDDSAALRSIGIDLDSVRSTIDSSFGDGAFDRLALEAGGPPHRRGWRRQPSPFNRRSKKVLELSLREALRLRTRAIGAEHLLLGIIREGEGLAVQILVESGVDLTKLRDDIVAATTTKAA